MPSNWCCSIFSSIPYLLLILAVAAVLQHKGTISPVVLILGLTGWTGVFRLIHAVPEAQGPRVRAGGRRDRGIPCPPHVQAHISPNVSHVVFVQISILVVAFIKSEVVLSFLGFGVPVDVVSWGSMLDEARNELLLGKWWQLVAAGVSMALLVTAFSLFTDALRDALDPSSRAAKDTEMGTDMAHDPTPATVPQGNEPLVRVRDLRIGFRSQWQRRVRRSQGHLLRHSPQLDGRPRG